MENKGMMANLKMIGICVGGIVALVFLAKVISSLFYFGLLAVGGYLVYDIFFAGDKNKKE